MIHILLFVQIYFWFPYIRYVINCLSMHINVFISYNFFSNSVIPLIRSILFLLFVKNFPENLFFPYGGKKYFILKMQKSKFRFKLMRLQLLWQRALLSHFQTCSSEQEVYYELLLQPTDTSVPLGVCDLEKFYHMWWWRLWRHGSDLYVTSWQVNRNLTSTSAAQEKKKKTCLNIL